jgi:hypothetical protein
MRGIMSIPRIITVISSPGEWKKFASRENV